MGFLMAAAPFLAAAGAGVSAISAISGGMDTAKAASFQAQVSRNNQTIATQNANYTTAAGETQAYDQGLKERATAGAITSGIAAGGLNVNEGSAKDVRVSQTGIGEEDIEQVRQRAALLAYGYKVSATNAGAEAQLNQAAAGQDIEAGWLRGLGSILGGAANVGNFQALTKAGGATPPLYGNQDNAYT